jgi:ABC-type amino acid transport substrate-binding protein
LDEKNNKEKEIVRLWRESIIPIDSIESLINKLNEIISKLNNEGTIIEYYDKWDIREYK